MLNKIAELWYLNHGGICGFDYGDEMNSYTCLFKAFIIYIFRKQICKSIKSNWDLSS